MLCPLTVILIQGGSLKEVIMRFLEPALFLVDLAQKHENLRLLLMLPQKGQTNTLCLLVSLKLEQTACLVELIEWLLRGQFLSILEIDQCRL